MAKSRYTTTQYASEEFVESCGAIVFDLSRQLKTVCLVHYHNSDEWLLAKGRRNCGESRHEAALREFREETGYQAHIHPVKMRTRAPPQDEEGRVPDEPRALPDITEPFMVTMRQLGDSDMKIIWWYVAALDNGDESGHCGEKDFTPRFFPLDEAVQMLSFEADRSVLRKAINILNIV
jgi:8-oxo-dGTP pyrophosphatase MutT (NUDIX family)